MGWLRSCAANLVGKVQDWLIADDPYPHSLSRLDILDGLNPTCNYCNPQTPDDTV